MPMKGKRGDRPETIEPEPAPAAPVDTAVSDAPAAPGAAPMPEPAGSQAEKPETAPDNTLKTYEKIIVKETIKHEFLQKELAEIADRMAQAAAAVYRLEKEKSESAAHFSAELKAANLRAGELVERYNNRYEMRDVECRVEFDKPEAGWKSHVRIDNETTVRELRMTEAERQRAFVFDAGDGKPQ